jgi:hypothetical protein
MNIRLRRRLRRKYRQEATAIYATPFDAQALALYRCRFQLLDKELMMHRNGLIQLTPYQVMKKKLKRTRLCRVLAAQEKLASGSIAGDSDCTREKPHE